MPFSSNLKLPPAKSFSLEESKICCVGKGLTVLINKPFENVVAKGEMLVIYSTQSKSSILAILRLLSVNTNAFNLGPAHSSVGSIENLRTGGRWFDPQLSQYSFRRLMIVIATGFIPLSPLSVVLTMVMWESSQWLGKNIVWCTG